MTSSHKNLDSNTVELTVELTQEDLGSYLRETETAYSHELEIPGFRKGKAPREMVRKHIGEARIREAALQTAMQRSLGQVIASEGLDVIRASDLAIKENSAEKLVYTVKLLLFPTMTLPELSTIKVPFKAVTVDNKEIDQTIQTIRESRATYSEKAEPAAVGDRVEVDFEVRENGSLIEGGVSKNHPVLIGDNKFIPGFEDALVGMKKDEQREFSLKVPADFANKEIAGKELNFKVAMQDVKKVSLPELNDDFARSLGKFDNIDQLIMNIKDGLTEEKEEKERQRVRLAIMNEVIDAARCDIPGTMIEDQLNTMIQNFDQDLHRHDMELSLYLAKIGKSQDDLKKDWRKEAERQVKMAIAVHTIARKYNISLDPKEIDTALESLMQAALAQGENQQNLDIDSMRSNIESRLLNEKTFEYLEKNCTA